MEADSDRQDKREQNNDGFPNIGGREAMNVKQESGQRQWRLDIATPAPLGSCLPLRAARPAPATVDYHRTAVPDSATEPCQTILAAMDSFPTRRDIVYSIGVRYLKPAQRFNRARLYESLLDQAPCLLEQRRGNLFPSHLGLRTFRVA